MMPFIPPSCPQTICCRVTAPQLHERQHRSVYTVFIPTAAGPWLCTEAVRDISARAGGVVWSP